MTVLDGIGSVYDNFRVHAAKITILGMAPTTSKSVANSCLDYEPGTAATTQTGVLSTVPNISIPGYRDGTLVANQSSMRRVNWMISNATKGENTTAFLLTSWLAGDKDDTFLVYCDYDVEFRNPAKAS
nr:MAG: hypothetical protein [Crogonang virus 108]